MKNKSTSAGRRTLWGREWTVYGSRENCRFADGVLTTQDCWAADESAPMADVDLSFTARAPETNCCVPRHSSF